MKSYNTSTNYNNIGIVAGCGRVGSNYVTATITSDCLYHNLGEFFNNTNWNIYIYMNIVRLMLENNSDYVFDFTNWIATLTDFLQKNLWHLRNESPMDEDLEMKRFLDVSSFDLYIKSTKFINNKLNKNTVAKIFLQNTSLVINDTRINNVDINQLLDICDTIVVPYRKNVLSTYISDKKAHENDIYYIDSKGVNQYRLKEAKEFKTEWNKDDYLRVLDHLTYTHDHLFKIYKEFDGNKCVINYEELHAQKDKVNYVQNIYDKNNINVKINTNKFYPTVKQTKDQPIENNFTNPEQFLEDLPNIQTEFNYEY
tara:strand:- start:234 stop:1169 length:936 start_codon:yes stop_codon:yes gene_type:complete